MKKSVEDIRRRLEEPEYKNNILFLALYVLISTVLFDETTDFAGNRKGTP